MVPEDRTAINELVATAPELQSLMEQHGWKFSKMKAFASREQDWRDVHMTIVRRGVYPLDWSYIRRQLGPLAEAKEDPGIM
jgi:hypothetical protein